MFNIQLIFNLLGFKNLTGFWLFKLNSFIKKSRYFIHPSIFIHNAMVGGGIKNFATKFINIGN